MTYNNIFTSTFDAETTGAIPSGYSGAWVVATPGLNGSAKKITASTVATLSRQFGGSDWSRVRLSFRLKTGASTSARQLRVYAGQSGTVPSVSNSALFLIVENTGQIQLRYGSLSTNLQAYTSDTEYYFQIDVDCVTSKVIITIDGTVYNNGGRGYDFYLGHAVSTIGAIAFDSGNGSAGVDDISVDQTVPDNPVEIVTPAAYQVMQRNSTSQANIAIVGRYAGSPSAIEARWNGGAWSTIATSPTVGTFTGTLTSQPAGQGTLDVRVVGDSYVASQSYVGIGDIFICAGQSNMSGRGTNNQTYTHATLKACLFGNDYTWKELTDPYDSATGQIDTVSSDAGGAAAAGSMIPLIATAYMAQFSIPCAFVPCALGGTLISSWQPNTNHQLRTTLYGSMVYRALQVGGCRMVIWWQGESDALLHATQSYYNASLDSLAAAIHADLGVKLMACTLANGSGNLDADEIAVNSAIKEAWADNELVMQGPDLFDIASDDTYHLKTDVKLETGASRWWVAIRNALIRTSTYIWWD